MKQNSLVVLVCIALLFATCANANDSIARVGTGGLELLKTDHIQMVSEVLEISTAKIRVKYHFLNTSNKDITTTVAFPMPAFDASRIPDHTRTNQRPLDLFNTSVNGTSVPVNKNRVFLINNIDATEKFRKIGLSDTQIFDPTFACMRDRDDGYGDFTKGCSITNEQAEAIRKMYARGTSGAWQIQETAYWEQTFPAGKEIEVIHEYPPFLGAGYGTGDPKEVCMDDGTRRAITNRIEAQGLEDSNNVPGGHYEVEYILGTGRNWKGPIKNFKLIIQKYSPDEIISLCFPGKPKRTSPLTIEFSRTDFVPQDRLIVSFISIGSPRMPLPDAYHPNTKRAKKAKRAESQAN